MLWQQQMVRLLAFRRRHRRFARYRRFWFLWLWFPQNSLNTRPADLNRSLDELPCDGASTEFRFWTKPPKFMYYPADRVVQLVPHDRASQQTSISLPFNGMYPVSQRVLMDHETLSGFCQRPTSQPHQLHDSDTLFGRVLRSLVRTSILSLSAKDSVFTAEQFHFRNRLISPHHHPQHRRRRQRQTCSRQLVSLAEKDGDRIDDT